MAVIALERRRRHIYAGEEKWFALLDELGPTAMRRGLIRCGVSGRRAATLVAFLEDQRDLEPHWLTGAGRGDLRAVLDEQSPEKVRLAARTIPG